jgi:3-hydroxyisobutyrate dehydrogenase
MKVAFIGLGNMGAPMALNLRKAGHEVTGHDVSESARTRTEADGLVVSASLEGAVANAQIVMSMLPASEHVESLYLSESGAGLLANLSPGTLVIDSSTIAAASARKVAEAALRARIPFLDAPVSGGVRGAQAGTLTFMVGGERSTFERAEPLLGLMGKNIFHAGAAGAGQATKICNNMLLGILMIGTAEALSLGVANGLDPKVLSQIMSRSSGGNWALDKYNPMPGAMDDVPSSRGYTGGFGTDLMLKDLGLAIESAVATRSATPLGSLARSLFAAHSLAGNGTLDFSSVIQLIRPPGLT